MTDIYLPELMELDSYWENAVKDAAESTIYSERRLEFALHNHKKINKILENSGYKHVTTEMMRNRKNSGKNKDEIIDEDVEVLTPTSYGRNLKPDLSAESMNDVEDEERTKSGPSTNKKAKLTPARWNYFAEKNRTCCMHKGGKKIKRDNVEFVREPLEEERENGKKSCLSRHYSKINPYVLRKKKLSAITAEIKRKKRNANVKRQEKRSKNLRMKGKACKTKRPRKKLDRRSNNTKCDEKHDNSKNQETKVDNSNSNEANGNVNNNDIKKSSVAGKEVPVTKKDSQNGCKNATNLTSPPTSEKDHSKGDCRKGPNLKEDDISKYGGVSKKMTMGCGLRGPTILYTVKRHYKKCLGSRKRKYKQKRRGKKKIGPFIKFYLTVYRELRGTCSIRSIAKEAGKRWKCLSRKEKLKFYPRKYK